MKSIFILSSFTGFIFGGIINEIIKTTAMKKLVMLAIAVLGTTAMVNAQTAPAKVTPVKEAKAPKKEKKADKKAKKAEAAKPEAAKAQK